MTTTTKDKMTVPQPQVQTTKVNQDFVIDLTSIPTRTTITPGWYNATIISTLPTYFTTGTTGVEVTYQLEDSTVKIPGRYSFTPQALVFLDELVEATDVERTPDFSDWDAFVGKEVCIRVQNNYYDGRMIPKVRGVRARDL